MGNEHRGLSNQAIEAADAHLHIPMRGMVQSLNLSVSAAVFLAEVARARQHDSAGSDYSLSGHEQAELTEVSSPLVGERARMR